MPTLYDSSNQKGGPIMQSQRDIFMHQTATGWTAIGSIVGAVSIIVLAVFNILYLKAARAASRASNAQAEAGQSAAQAASKQAEAADKTLRELRYQFTMHEIAQKEIALAALNEVARNARSWRESLHTDRSINDKASLMPPNWSQVMVFVGQQVPAVMTEMIDVERQISETERQLNDFVHVPLSMRHSQLTSPKIQPLRSSLEKTADDAEKIVVTLRGWGAKKPS